MVSALVLGRQGATVIGIQAKIEMEIAIRPLLEALRPLDNQQAITTLTQLKISHGLILPINQLWQAVEVAVIERQPDFGVFLQKGKGWASDDIGDTKRLPQSLGEGGFAAAQITREQQTETGLGGGCQGLGKVTGVGKACKVKHGQ